MSTSADLYRELEARRTALLETYVLYTEKLSHENAALRAAVAAAPVAAQPVAAQPVAAQPVAADPVAAQPVAAAPVAAQPVAADPVPTEQELQRARWRLEKRPEWQGKDAATRRQMIHADVLAWRNRSEAPALPGFAAASMPRMNLRAPIPSHYTPEQAAALEKRRAADREYARKKRLAQKEYREHSRKVMAEAAALRAKWAKEDEEHLLQAQAQVA